MISKERYDQVECSKCESQSDVEYLEAKWKTILTKGDPYYNKNLR